jgi:site-specific recombinase XerD
VLELWVQSLQAQRLSDLTVHGYRRDVDYLLGFLAEFGRTLLDATLEDLRAWLARMKVKASTAARRVSSVRNLFAWMLEEGLREDNPALRLKGPRRRHSPPRVLTHAEFQAVLETQKGPRPYQIRNYAMLLVLYSTGCRCSEFVGMQMRHINHLGGSVRVIGGKGDKDRTVILSPSAQEALGAWLEVRRSYFLAGMDDISDLWVGRSGKPPTRNVIAEIVRSAAEDLGLGAGVTPHTFRHTLATHLYANNVDLLAISQLLGHADLRTTQKYIQIAPDVMRAKLDGAFAQGSAHPHGG